MDVSKNRGGPPKWMVKIMENLIKMDDLGETHYFWKHPYTIWRGPLPSSVDEFSGPLINQDIHGSGDRHRSFPGGIHIIICCYLWQSEVCLLEMMDFSQMVHHYNNELYLYGYTHLFEQ